MKPYSAEDLASIFELGRLYYDMGYVAAAERIFSGLTSVDEGQTPANIGVGLIKREHGLSEEAMPQFRAAMRNRMFQQQAKIGLSLAFLGIGDRSRAQSLLHEMRAEIESSTDTEMRTLWEALCLRCGVPV